MRKIAFLFAVHQLTVFGFEPCNPDYKFDESFVRTVLEQKQDLSNLSSDESPLLHKYLYSHLPELLKPLLQLKPNVNIEDKFYRRPLNFAIGSCNVICVKDLLKAGANLNTILRSPLSDAIVHTGDPIITELLLRYGANPRQEPYLILALRECPSETKVEIVKLLLQYGAQPEDHDVNILRVTKYLYDEMCSKKSDKSKIQSHKDANKIFLKYLRVRRLASGITFNGKSLPKELVARICQFWVE